MIRALTVLALAGCGPVSSRAAHQRLASRHFEMNLWAAGDDAYLQRQACLAESDAECLQLQLGHACALDNFEHERRTW